MCARARARAYVRERDRQTDRQTQTQTDRQTGRQAGRHTYRQTNRDTDRQTETETERQRDRDRETESVHAYVRYFPHGIGNYEEGNTIIATTPNPPKQTPTLSPPSPYVPLCHTALCPSDRLWPTGLGPHPPTAASCRHTRMEQSKTAPMDRDHFALRPQKRGGLLGTWPGVGVGGGGDQREKARPRIPPEKDRRDRGPPPEQWRC